MTTENKIAVLAIGGNSLIRDKAHRRVSDQFEVTRVTCEHIAAMIQSGWSVVITHGNGPQVGFIMRRAELAIKELHPVPMDSCGADTQGAIGYMIQQSLANEFRKKGIGNQAVTVVTQVLVDREDPAFKNPSKPIGSFMDEETAKRRESREGWHIKEDAGRGWRRVVPSPLPREIVELGAILDLIRDGYTVIAVGGGGIPVIRNEKGALQGIEAVIDKDHATSLLAQQMKADLFLISTAVEQVCLNFGTPEEQALSRITLSEAKGYMKEGHFPSGSMGPKMQSVIDYLEGGGKAALITHPEKIEEALLGNTGTWIVQD